MDNPMIFYMRTFAVAFFTLFVGCAYATIDACAVTVTTPDGFVALRSGPGVNFSVVRKILPGDGLYGGFTECEQSKSAGGRAPVCDQSGNWYYVEKVCPLPGCSQTGQWYKGWVSRKFIRFIGCT